jgi:hypothetical protein
LLVPSDVAVGVVRGKMSLERLQKAAQYAGVGEPQSEIAEALEINRQRMNGWFKGGGPIVS